MSLGLVARAVVFAIAAVSVSGCGLVPHPDPLSELPTVVAGEVIQYDLQYGNDAPDWAHTVLKSTGRPESALTATRGDSEGNGNINHSYQSFVVRVAGVDGRTLIDPAVHAFGLNVTDIWTETIAGKTTTRFSIDDEDRSNSMFYAYAYDDVVVVILSQRLDEAEEALRQMP